jgi:crossover junction endodeoxyribonuclease RuvC
MIKKSSSIILGIDPGFGSIGYGAISITAGIPLPLTYGCLHTEPKSDFSKRLVTIFESISVLIKKLSPRAIGVEKLFFEKNSKTAIEVSHARGVILLAAELAGIPIVECTPLQVKLAATGYGKAEKRQVQQMVARVLKLSQIPRPDDAADALAIALCASTMYRT